MSHTRKGNNSSVNHTDVAHIAEKRNTYRVLVGKPEGTRRGRPRHKWEDNIKMDAREIGWEDMNLINVAQDRGKW
jgi:hypothetical protein